MRSPSLRTAVSRPPVLAAAVEWGEAYEALLALAMLTGDEPEESYEVGRDWFVRARRAASPSLKAAIKNLVGAAGPRWFLLLGLVHEVGGRRDVASLLSRLQRSPAEDVLLALLGGHLPRLRLEEGRRLVAQALVGDLKAAAGVAARSMPGERRVVEHLSALGPASAKALTLEVLERWDDEVFAAGREEWSVLLEADARALDQASTRLSPEEMIDHATRGIRYEGEAGIDRVLLIPSLVSRPWIVISEWDSTKIFCYPAHPGAAGGGEQQREMIRVYRALGDETRLRILREMAGGNPRRIADLAHSLGLAKSTIHSHLATLRAAGLVRLRLGAEKRYELRKGRPDLNRLLDDYLGD
jgi:DNA-binding transcriptional ArsR family regulator